jgi:hypothetical protein
MEQLGRPLAMICVANEDRIRNLIAYHLQIDIAGRKCQHCRHGFPTLYLKNVWYLLDTDLLPLRQLMQLVNKETEILVIGGLPVKISPVMDRDVTAYLASLVVAHIIRTSCTLFFLRLTSLGKVSKPSTCLRTLDL